MTERANSNPSAHLHWGGGKPASLRQKSADRGAAVVVSLAALLVAALFVWIVGDLVWHGAGHLSWEFLITAPSEFGRSGGIFPMFVSTLLILGVALAASVPVGVATAIGIAEFSKRGGALAALIGRSLDVVAAVPSIVFGLFGNAFFCNFLGLGYSILAGGLTLACMVLPILIRSLEVAFRSVPDDYRIAAAALGMSKTRTVGSILLPMAMPGLVVGLVLSIGRVLAETAALLYTSGYVDRMPRSLLDSGRTLSIHIYDLSMNVAGGEPTAYATALVLVGLLLMTNSAAIWVSDRWLHRSMIVR